MNKNTAKDYIPLVQALAEGKVIESLWSYDWKDSEWKEDVNPSFSEPASHYRIKRESGEIWVNKSYSGIIDGAVYESEAEAKSASIGDEVQVRYREVIE